MRSLALFCFVLLAGTPRNVEAAVRAALQDVRAAAADTYIWNVTKSVNASGPVSVAAGATASVACSAAFTRARGPPATRATGAVVLTNPGGPDAVITSVMVDVWVGGEAAQVVSQPATCGAAVAATAAAPPLPLTLAADAAANCSFALVLPLADAHVFVARVLSSSSTGVTAGADGASSAAVSVLVAGTVPPLGECAVMTDTFSLAPATAEGKAPSLGAGVAVCASLETSYTAVFGPFSADLCGSVTVTSSARASPTNGNQSPYTTPSTPLTILAACPAADAQSTAPPTPSAGGATPPAAPAAPSNGTTAPAPLAPPLSNASAAPPPDGASGSPPSAPANATAPPAPPGAVLPPAPPGTVQTASLQSPPNAPLPDSAFAVPSAALDPSYYYNRRRMLAVRGATETASGGVDAAAAAVPRLGHGSGGGGGSASTAAAPWPAGVLAALRARLSRRRLLAAPAAPAPNVTVASLAVAQLTRYTWDADKQATPTNLTLPLGGEATAEYAVRFTRSGAASAAELTGKVAVRNPARGAPLRLAKVAVEVRWERGNATGLAVCPGADANGAVSVAANATLTCSFKLEAGGLRTNGTLAAYVIAAGNATERYGSAARAFKVQGAPQVVAGECAVASDTFRQPDARVWGEGVVVAGAKPPPVASGGATICANQTFAYTMAFNSSGAQPPRCGEFSVLSLARANPVNGSQALVSSAAPVWLTVTGCTPPAPPQPPPPPLAAEQVAAVARLVRPVAAVTVNSSGPASALFRWSAVAAATPATPIAIPSGGGTGNATFTATFTRATALGAGGFLTGRVVLSNPNLVERMAFALVSVEVARAGGGAAYVARATCPATGEDGLVTLRSVLETPDDVDGAVHCSFYLELGDDAGGTLVATALTADGKEVASAPATYTLGGDAPPEGAAGACAVVGATFAPGRAAGGGGTASGTALCETGNVTFSYTFGPFENTTCGAFNAVGVITATPGAATPQPPALTAAPVALLVTGCSGASLSATLDRVAIQNVSSFTWGVRTSATPTAVGLQRADDYALKTTIKVTKAARPTYSLHAVGRVVLSNSAASPLTLTKVQVVLQQGAVREPVAALAECPLDSAGRLVVPAATVSTAAGPPSGGGAGGGGAANATGGGAANATAGGAANATGPGAPATNATAGEPLAGTGGNATAPDAPSGGDANSTAGAPPNATAGAPPASVDTGAPTTFMSFDGGSSHVLGMGFNAVNLSGSNGSSNASSSTSSSSSGGGSSSTAGTTTVPGTLTCTFRVTNLVAADAQVVAEARLTDGTPKLSAPAKAAITGAANVTFGECALVTSAYLSGAGLVAPNATGATTSPGGRQQQLCAGQDVTSEDTLGPFRQCGSYRAVFTARVEPTIGITPPQTASSTVNVTVSGCGAGSPGSG